MDEKEKKQKQTQLLQLSLRDIRQIAGWTAEQLGEKIGVTKQTISNLENAKTPMSLTQYLAIRSILEDEIESNKENSVLKTVIEILVDKGAELEKEEYAEIKDTIDTMAASASKGKKGAYLEKILKSLLTPESISKLAILGIVLIQSGKTSGLKKIIK